MCGIVAQFERSKVVDRQAFVNMVDSLSHRGPDDHGVFFDEEWNLALGHARLSFLDLSSKGRQPMASNRQCSVVSYNGEIYNYAILRSELSDEYDFVTDTDTEVILAGYEKWGVDLVNKLKGMFAFVIFDRKQDKLILVRDRFGVKPLYYHLTDERFMAASELKPLIRSGLIERKMDVSAFCDYFVYRYIPSPKTIWSSIAKLPPAHLLEVNLTDMSSNLTEYWRLGVTDGGVDDTDMVGNVDSRLRQSVSEHLIADVPVGSFLSGGYDSSALVSYAKSIGYDVATYSIGFEDWENSEHIFAKEVAKHLGCKNKYVIAGIRDLELLDVMPEVFDEPIADISIVPTFMVSRLARTEVKAVLSGEGADELFGGYTWQKDFYRINNEGGWFGRLKRSVKPIDVVEYYARSMAMGWFDGAELGKLLNPELHQGNIPIDVHWFYRQHYNPNVSPLKSIQLMDIKCFMGELVLTKIDRATMANSLEARVPFLDHELFELVFSQKEDHYYKPNVTKYLLFENIKKALPQSILNRKKQGFVGPDQYYMNIQWYRKALSKSTLIENRVINAQYVNELLLNEDHWRLWKLTVMEKWYAHYFS